MACSIEQPQLSEPKLLTCFREVVVILHCCKTLHTALFCNRISFHLLARQVKKAFFALVANGVRAAPLWDTEKQSFVGKNAKTGTKVALWSYLISAEGFTILFLYLLLSKFQMFCPEFDVSIPNTSET